MADDMDVDGDYDVRFTFSFLVSLEHLSSTNSLILQAGVPEERKEDGILVSWNYKINVWCALYRNSHPIITCISSPPPLFFVYC